jgi:hypothetical protein
MRNQLRSFLDLVDLNLLDRRCGLARRARQFLVDPPVEFQNRLERPYRAGKPMSALAR